MPAWQIPMADGTALKTFDDFSHTNGATFWYARELMTMLGYTDYGAFRKRAVERAIAACMRLDIPIAENFIECTVDADEGQLRDLKLTRFACYLIAMNGDPRKPAVAQAQGYFAGLAESIHAYLDGVEHVERIAVRGEIADQEKVMAATAYQHGVQEFSYFQNAGYRGMYNMNLSDLKVIKGVPAGRSALDFMGAAESAANLFRITQTEERIRRQDLHGQRPLEDAAALAGRTVREAMIKLGSAPPEQLAPGEDIRSVRSGLKATSRQFTKMDKLPPPKQR